MGRLKLFSTRAIIRKMAIRDTAVTTAKSWSVVSIMSFMQGASPMSIPPWSYFFRISFKVVSWAFTSSLAGVYSELMSISFQFLLSSFSRAESGIISSGIREPTTLSNPKAYFTPSTFSISSIMFRTSLEEVLASTRTMWVEAMSKSFCSLRMDTT